MKLGFLRPLYEQTGGWVSAYLDTSRAHENAPGEVALRRGGLEENAKELAARVAEAAGRIGAARIVIAGDARARSLLLRHLSTGLQALAVVLDMEAPAGSDALAEAARQALAEEEDKECRARFGHWQVQLAHGAGTEGLAPTLTGLSDGQVSELFVAGRPTSTASAWIGPAATELAASQTQLRDRGWRSRCATAPTRRSSALPPAPTRSCGSCPKTRCPRRSRARSAGRATASAPPCATRLLPDRPAGPSLRRARPRCDRPRPGRRPRR
jgi:hypothetical protein